MKVVDNRFSTNKIPLGALVTGDLFEHEGVVYMRCESREKKNSLIPIVSIGGLDSEQNLAGLSHGWSRDLLVAIVTGTLSVGWKK